MFGLFVSGAVARADDLGDLPPSGETVLTTEGRLESGSDSDQHQFTISTGGHVAILLQPLSDPADPFGSHARLDLEMRLSIRPPLPYPQSPIGLGTLDDEPAGRAEEMPLHPVAVAGLPSGLTGTVTVVISSDSSGSDGQEYRLRVSNATIDRPEIRVYGTPLFGHQAEISSGGSIDMGQSNDGEELHRTIVLGNTGSEFLFIDDILLTGPDADEFELAFNPTSVHQSSLPPSTQTQLRLEFNPTSLGTKSATAWIYTDDPDQAEFTFDIAAESALTPPRIMIQTDGQYDFLYRWSNETTGLYHVWLREQRIGNTRQFWIRVRNNGGTELHADIELLPGTGSNAGPGVEDYWVSESSIDVAAGESSRKVFVAFAPSSGGFRHATVAFHSNDPTRPIHNIHVYAEGLDNCPDVEDPDQSDLDGDGLGDVCDDDIDGDGMLNDADNCPMDYSLNFEDSDGDGIGDVCDDDIDGDGVIDDEDGCPLTADPDQPDLDGDGIGDACDDDLDGDGFANAEDVCPLDADPDQSDLDGDGVGDACDDDIDGDGLDNWRDNCPFIANSDQSDSDGDDVGDACDDDIDGDGILNFADNCPLVHAPDLADQDGDGIGDACDDDVDGDGIADTSDNCPNIANVDQANLDGDGIGDACDDDIDGDGVPNTVDDCLEDDAKVEPGSCGCGKPDIDSDGDGTADCLEPNEPSPPIPESPPEEPTPTEPGNGNGGADPAVPVASEAPCGLGASMPIMATLIGLAGIGSRKRKLRKRGTGW